MIVNRSGFSRLFRDFDTDSLSVKHVLLYNVDNNYLTQYNNFAYNMIIEDDRKSVSFVE